MYYFPVETLQLPHFDCPFSPHLRREGFFFKYDIDVAFDLHIRVDVYICAYL
jgi:hypothetical protein